ncbi:MAG TPA: hypothetical protein VJ690_10420 [Burkholderiales bacterium]|nr:hypothetical protein [Burkholderiales bacterium]
MWLFGVRAADLAYLVGINDINASQEKLFRDWKLPFHPFPYKLVLNVQLCGKCLDRPHDLSGAPHGACVYCGHAMPSL